jgi:hypothetical protein
MARVSPLISQVAFGSQASDVDFDVAGVLEGFHRPCRGLVSFPVRSLFLSTFQWISMGEIQFPFDFARVAHTVLMRGSNRLPSG